MNHSCFQSPSELVGIESRLKKIKSLLNLEEQNVQMFAICGTRGIGKTTIAEAIYNDIGRDFRYRGFCRINVSDTSRESSQNGLLKLQLQLRSETVKTCDSDGAANMIKQYCHGKETLLVIDNVNGGPQLQKLIGRNDFFGPRSRIIVTTRDDSLLIYYGKEMKPYHVPLLNHAEARVLFTRTAFLDNDNVEADEKITEDAVEYADGVPRILIAAGCSIRSTPPSEWKSALQIIKNYPPPDIFAPLEKSSLNDHERTAFLDIACFLKGQPERHVRNILECCDLLPDHVMGTLKRKHLIFIKNKKVDMHDWLQEMGRKFVRDELGECNRFWDPEEVRGILRGETVGEKIEGMKIELDAPEEVTLSEKAFIPLNSLRLFLAYKAQYSGDPIKFPKTLRCLEWEGYSSSLMPLNGSADCKLAGLYMRESKIKHIGNVLEVFRNLRFLYLSRSKLLTHIPDLSSLCMLEILDAEGCTNLEEVHQSLGELEKLVCLNFLDCAELRTFPLSLNSSSLKELTLIGCVKLQRFPDIQVGMGELERLSLHKTNIDVLPSSIEKLIGLKELYLDGCIRLGSLPNGIYMLQSLQRVSLNGCCGLDKFPEYADGCSSSPSTQKPLLFPNVVHIDLRGCSLGNIDFMSNLGCTSTLKRLDLSGNKLVTIPEFIGDFSALEELHLENCKQLHDIKCLPPKMRDLHAEGCESLKRCVSSSRFLDSESVERHQLDFSGCYKLSEDDIAICSSIEDLTSKIEIWILHPGSEIPKWFDCERQSTEGLITFSVYSEVCENIDGLALCMITGSEGMSRESFSCDIVLKINNQYGRVFQKEMKSLGSDHIWSIYVPCHRIPDWDRAMREESIEFEVQFDGSWGYLKRCGVHLVLKKKRQATPPLGRMILEKKWQATLALGRRIWQATLALGRRIWQATLALGRRILDYLFKRQKKPRHS